MQTVLKLITPEERAFSIFKQARSELVRQEHQVGSLNSCIHEFQQQAYAQGLELRDAHHGHN